MKKTILAAGMLLMSALILLNSCKKDTAGEGNDEEVITTMNLKFTPAGGGTSVTFSFDDPDGPGGNLPTQSTISLNRGISYNVEVELLNKTATPVINVTAEVIAEPDAHRFYYEPAGAAPVTITNLNNDANAVPLGVTSLWTAGSAAGTGTVKVTLRHYGGTPPDKAVADPVNSPKSATDVQVTFNTITL